MKLEIRLTASSSKHGTTDYRTTVFVKEKPFICVKLACCAFRCVILFGRLRSYNYSAIRSPKFPEVSLRTFKTKGLISIEGTFLGHPVVYYRVSQKKRNPHKLIMNALTKST